MESLDQLKEYYNQATSIFKSIAALRKKGESIPDSSFEMLESVFKEIMQIEEFFLITGDNKFWGNVLISIDREVDFNIMGPVDIDIRTTPFTLKYNPLYCCQMSFSEFTGTIVNELTKLVMGHPEDYARINNSRDEETHRILDVASSLASTTILQKDMHIEDGKSKIRLTKDLFTVSGAAAAFNNRPNEMESFDYYFKYLQNAAKGNNGQLPQMPGSQSAFGDEFSEEEKKNGKSTHAWEGKDPQDIKDKIRYIVRDAYNAMNATDRGTIPGSIMERINFLLSRPEINWRDYLRRLIGTIPVPYRKSRTRLNRRQPLRGDLCGRLPRYVIRVIACLDTSGSMSDAAIQYCLSETWHLAKERGCEAEMYVVECDCSIGRVSIIKNEHDIELLMKKGITGRGGTYFTPSIEYINGASQYKNKPKEFPNAGKFADAIMVYFTDGYGENEIPKPHTYKNLWVVLGDESHLSLSQPYGEVKSLSKDKAAREYIN